MISLRLDKQAESVRKEFQTWLKSNPPPAIKSRIELEQFVEISRTWQRRLASERWVGVHWPEKFGGRGLRLVEEALIQETLAEVNAPQLVNLFGLTMVGPVLIKHGTLEQQERFLKRMLTADEIWCQGFSEPEAGSDLAALKTSAELSNVDGQESWTINGQKVWTSFAQYAEMCFLLARSDAAALRHKGLSYFLVPMNSNGITVRPLTQITGDREFNEVFFDNVSIAAENIVGKPGEGWAIAISTLMYERVVLTFARHLQSESLLQEIRTLLCHIEKPERFLIQKFGRLVASSMAVRALALSHLVTYDSGASPGPEGSLDKLGWSETFQEICKFALEVLGQKGVFTEGEHAYSEGALQHQYLYSRGRTIAAGTSEIQRNIIAERLLGLTKNI